MSYKVTLYHNKTGKQGSVAVDAVHYRDFTGPFWVEIVGAGPPEYPAFVRESEHEDRRWFSKGPTLFLAKGDPIDVINVAPITEPTPDPEPTLE